MLTESNPNATITSVDGISAYETMSRGAMLSGLAEVDPSVLPFVSRAETILCGPLTCPADKDAKKIYQKQSADRAVATTASSKKWLWDDNWPTTSAATAGLRSAIMGKASAHDAQKSAGAHLSAECRPNPPIRIGNVEMLRASFSCSTGTWPNNLLAVSHIPSSWARQ